LHVELILGAHVDASSLFSARETVIGAGRISGTL